QIPVLSFGPPAVWKLYRVDEKGQSRLVREVALQDFLQEEEQTRIKRGIHLYFATISPDHAYLACTYHGYGLPTDSHDLIHLYDLATGKRIREIAADFKRTNLREECRVQWCGWHTGNLLRITEFSNTEGHSPYHLKIKEVDVQTGQTQV